jgi:hypothetical protein
LGRSSSRSFAAALAILLFTTAAWAQATAELSGTVRDESGAVLPGVTVVATQIDTGFSRTAVTDGGGVYAMPNLPTGPYRLEVSLQGFRTYVQTGIVLQVAAAPTINAVLAVGNLEETVAVEAAAPLVDVRSAGISEVVEQERILELPLQGRNVTDLIVLAGAAVSMGNAGPKSIPGSIGIGVAGGLPIGVAYTLDGAMHNNPYDNYNMPLPFPDALQEFSVATSGLSAQSGTHAGGSVNAVTKSGTNTLHGNLFEFVRDKKFNATAAFSPVGPDGKKLDDGLIRHQPGGTIGGPIVQDRLFFFGGYQGTFVRVNPPTAQSRVPTAAMLAGDFAAATSPACNAGRQIALRAPFVNNQISPALFSPAAINVAKQLPSSTDPCGEIRFSAPEEYDQGQIVGKVDYQAGANHSIFGRYMITFSDKQPGWPGSGNVLTTRPADTAQKHRAHSLTVGDTRVFGANTVNSVRVAWNRSQAGYHLEPYFGPEQIGVRNYHNYVPGVMSITVTGGFMTANGGSVLGQFDTDAYQVGDNLTLVRGAHQITLGSDVAYWQSDSLDGQRGGGVWQFNGSATGLGLADFLTGSVFSMGQARPGVLPMSQWHVGTYAQDSWRTSDRITINVGLRWEPFLGQNVRNNAIYNFSRENYQQRIRSTVFPNAPLGLVYPGDSGSPGQAALKKQWTNLAPRAGIAWDVTGDGRTAVRSSYALAYDFMQAAYLWYSATSAPFSNRIEIRSPAGGFDDPYRGWPGRLPHPMPDVVTAADAYFPDFGAYGAVDPDINSTRVQSWNVIVERQIGTAWQVSASYLGSYTDRLWGQVQLNPGVFRGLGPCTIAGVVYPSCTVAGNLEQRRALFMDNPVTSQLGPIDLHDDVGKQDYRALKLSVQRRAASGLRLGGNYTLSRCMGNTVTSTFQQIGAGYLKPDDPAFDIGHCLQDRTHIGNITIGAETPQFQSAAMRVLASDWRVSGILNARSGSWLTVTTGRDIAGTGIQNQRPNEVKDSPYGDRTLLNYLTPTAFAYPDAGTLGDHKRGSIEGPGFWTIDLALSRIVGFASQQNVELRFEVFNLLNNFNWGDPVTNLDAGNFGQIISQTGDPRIMQFGIKYGF